MADAYGGTVGHWRAHVAAWITSEGQDYADIHSEVRFQVVDGWHYSSLSGNFGASVAGQTASSSTSGGISVGSNGEQTIAAKDLRIWKGHGGQNVSFDGYINITGYASGGSSAGGSIYIGGRPAHTVSYNANGGAGAPGNQTKWYGESLFLSNDRPTRALYEFRGWSLNQGSSNVDYNPGQQWFPDEDHTLYAVWKLSVVAPTITSLAAIRCLSDGTPANDGTYVKVTCTWSVDTVVDSNNTGSKLTVSYDGTNDANTISGTSGTFSKIYENISISSGHTFIATLADSHLSNTSTAYVGPAKFILDINEDGSGIGIGQAAPTKGIVVCGTFFANSLEELPTTAADVGPKGTTAIVAGREYVFDGAGTWSLKTPRIFRYTMTHLIGASAGDVEWFEAVSASTLLSDLGHPITGQYAPYVNYSACVQDNGIVRAMSVDNNGAINIRTISNGPGALRFGITVMDWN
jgi:hypothetical protein